jgi:eukaryotic-like serine/threonine-protein kinase
MEPGQRIGDYEVLEELGRGGMGGVYRVRNVLSNRFEAMKVLLPALVDSPELAERFLREIRVLAALDHPNIAALRTALTAGDQVVMVMELVEGEPLSRRVRRDAIPIADAVAYTTQVLGALAYAHDQGVIHRDVKPANMMLTPDGTIKLTDFGIARSVRDRALTSTGSTTGSLAYMSPEQVNGSAVDARSDLYSAGISAYEMLTGRTPFQGQSEFMLMAAHVNEPPVAPVDLRPDMPAALNGAILRAIAKKPDDRFQTAHEFREAVVAAGSIGSALPAPGATIVSPAPVAPRPAPLPTAALTSEPARRPRLVHPLVYVGLGGVLVVIAAAGTGSFLRRAEAETSGASQGAQPPDPSEPGARAQPSSDVVTPGPQPPTSLSNVPAAAREASPATSVSTGAAPARADAGAQAADFATSAKGTNGSAGSTPAVADAVPPIPRDAATVPSVAAQPSPAAARQQVAVPVPDVERVERELDRVSIRAGAVNESVDRLREEQARQGLGLRGDIVARQRSMSLNLSRAEEALGRGDTAAAERYSGAAQSDAEAIEKFLGR